MIEALPKIVALECNIAILGEGEGKYHDALKAIADKHHNIYVAFGYDEALSHRMYAAADFFLMPSLFEPCGLAQMIAMHYGSLPIVHHVGGLADTVHNYKDFDAKTAKGYGIVFSEPKAEVHFLKPLIRLLNFTQIKAYYNKIVKHNMRCDFSWQESAKSYLEIYEKITEKSSDG